MQLRQFSTVTLASLCLVACSSGTSKEVVDKAERDVLAVHDELMPRIGDVLKLNKQLRQRADSLDKVKTTDATATIRITEEKAEIKQLSRRLNESDSLMMGWMDGYKGDTLQKLKPDQALSYLKEQQTKIDDVKQKINGSIEQARAFLKK